jgi:malate synthase
VAVDDGRVFDAELYREIRDAELAGLREEAGDDVARDLDRAADLLDRLVLEDDFIPFLTIPGLEILDRDPSGGE